MKKLPIGALVGGIILFLWQFLSWSMLGIHEDMQQYSPNQEKVLQALGENLEEGFYFMPGTPPGSAENPMEANAGKPWAQVYYHKSMNVNMGMMMGRGIIINIIAIGLLIWILTKIPNVSFQNTVLSSVAVGLIGYLVGAYTYSIWFETKSIGNLIDAVVSFGLVGAWLGWWLKR